MTKEMCVGKFFCRGASGEKTETTASVVLRSSIE